MTGRGGADSSRIFSIRYCKSAAADHAGCRKQRPDAAGLRPFFACTAFGRQVSNLPVSFRENSAASCRVAKSDLVDRDEKIFFEHSSFVKPRRPATLRSSMPAPARSASFLLTDAEYLGVTASFHCLKTACTIPFIRPRTRCPRPAPAWSISSMAACSSGDMSTPF